MGCGGSKAAEEDPSPQPKPGVSQSKPQPGEPEPEPYHPFTEFPTPLLLAKAQVEYAHWRTQHKPQGYPNDKDVPFPPPKRRDEEFPPGRFDAIDEHVLETPDSLVTDSLQQLVSHLIRPATNDADKVRAIFVWIASQNLLRYEFIPEKLDRNTALFHLVCAKANIGSYTTLLSEMCKCATIPCKTITGRAKGASYRLGEDIVYGNTWCTVLADGSWRLVDQNFGSCFVTGYEDDQWELVSYDTGNKRRAKKMTHYNMNDGYLFTDPEVFIYDHFAPDDPTDDPMAMQLLARPITHEEYIDMARLRPYFFRYGIIDTSHPRCRITTDSGLVKFHLTLPKENALKFTFELYKMRGMEELATFNKDTMKDYAVMDRTPEQDTMKLNVRVPLKYIGNYKLVLQATDKKLSPNVSGYICEYLLHCERPDFNCKPHPRNDKRDEFGPGADTMLLGMTPINYQEGVIHTKEGIADIRFKSEDPELEFKQVLKSSEKELKPILGQYNRHYLKEDEAVFHVKTPKHGTYLLELHARKSTHVRKSFDNVCNYLLISDVGCTDPITFPENNSGRLGATNQGDQVLMPVSHPEAIFTLPDEGSVEIEMRCRTQLEIQLQLELHTESHLEEVDCTDFTWYEVTEDRLRCFLRFPHAGMYNFSIFAKEAGKKGVFVEAWKYVITVDQLDDDCMPFPFVFDGWKPTYSLKKPRGAYLLEDEPIEFEIEVPGAEDVVLMQDDTFSNQSLVRQDGDVFQGIAKTRGPGLTVCAMFGDDVEFERLLEYKVMTSEEKAEIEEQQSRSKQEAKLRLVQLENRRKSEEEAAKKRKEEDEENVRKETEIFEINKDKHWEEERRLEKEAEDEHREFVKKEEERLRQQGTHLSEAETDDKIRKEIKKISEAKDSEKMNLKRLQAKQTARMVRQNMRDATKRRNREDLGTLVSKFTALELQEEDGDLTKAKNMLSLLEAKHALHTATLKRSTDDIVESIERIKLEGHHHALQNEVQEAEMLLRRLRRLHHAKLNVLQMEPKTMSEICSYRCPPDDVHQVMKASFLLLGKNEDTTSDWKTCRQLSQPLGQNGLNRRLHRFEIQDLHPEICARSKEMLQGLEFEQVQDVSAGAATFYVWAMATLEQAGDMTQQQGDQIDAVDWNKPANIPRQKQIFGDPIIEEDVRSPRKSYSYRSRRGNNNCYNDTLNEPELIE